MQIHDFAGMTGEERQALSRVLEAQESLDDVVRLGPHAVAPDHPRGRRHPGRVQLRRAGPLRGGALGGVRDHLTGADTVAVSVWDHRPTAAELLEQRLASGWRPKPSLLKEGDVVEGYAAC